MEAEASHELKLNRSVLNLTRKQRGIFLQGPEEATSSSLQSFLSSMLEAEAEEKSWRTETPDVSLLSRPGQARQADCEAEHSSLPDVRLGSPWDQASLTRPVYWHAGAQNLQPGSSLGSVVECGSGETRGLQHTTPPHHPTELMVRGDTRAGLQPPVRRTSSTSSSSSRSRHDSVAAEKMSTSEKCPIVRPAIRLPRDLIEKMPSAPNTPVSARKDHVASKLASSPGSPGSVTKKSPVTVASMVRR